MNDWELLQDYVRSRSSAAFAQLVERHIRWVHSVCARRTRDAHLAEDVTQAVFLLLSQKAARLPAGTSITGWLYRAARLTSSNAMQSRRRRLQRETTYATRQPTEQTSPTAATFSSDSALVAAIEAGLSRLRRGDRELLILHFYGNKTLAEAASELGVSVEAARKRFSRAMDALRERIAQQGVSVPAVGGAAALARAVESVTPVLPQTLSAWLAGGASPSAVSSGAAAIARSVAFKSVATLLLAGTGTVAAAVAIMVFVTRPTPPAAGRTSAPSPAPAITAPRPPPAAALTFSSTPLVGHNMPVISVTVSPNGRFGVSRSFGEIVRWDLAASKAIGDPFATTVPQPAAIAVGDSGLVVALDRRDILVFDSPTAVTPRRITPSSPGPRAIHWSLAIAPGDREIAVGGADGSIQLLDLSDGRELSAFPSHARAVNTLAFSPDGKSILSGGMDDHLVVLSDRATGKEIHRFEGQTSLIAALGFSPDGQAAFSFGRDRTIATTQPTAAAAASTAQAVISIWDLATGAERQKLVAPAPLITGATFTPDGRHLAAVCSNHVIVWDIATGREVSRYPLPDPKNAPLTAAFSHAGRIAVLGGGLRRGNAVDLIDLRDALTGPPASP